jgi:hypothetical protein
MSDAMMSSITNFGAEVQSSTGNPRSSYQLSVASPVNETQVSIPQANDKGASIAVGQHLEEASSDSERGVIALSIRRLYKEIEYAKSELSQLESNVSYDLFSPSVREWLLPLMAIGLALSLYGSFSASNSAELGATGLMLLWSLSAFWFIYSRDKRLEMAKQANKAEIEIWSDRIEELQQSLEQTQRIAEVTGE